MRRDRECSHLIQAWSSGGLHRIGLCDLFPGINSSSVVLRKPESRVVGWSLDLQELVHLLAVLRFTGASRILEVGTYDGFTTLNLAANLPLGGSVATVDLPPATEQKPPPGITNVCSDATIGEK